MGHSEGSLLFLDKKKTDKKITVFNWVKIWSLLNSHDFSYRLNSQFFLDTLVQKLDMVKFKLT